MIAGPPGLRNELRDRTRIHKPLMSIASTCDRRKKIFLSYSSQGPSRFRNEALFTLREERRKDGPDAARVRVAQRQEAQDRASSESRTRAPLTPLVPAAPR